MLVCGSVETELDLIRTSSLRESLIVAKLIGIETDKDDGSNYEEEGTAKSSGVKIVGMQMLTREQSTNKNSVSGLKDKSDKNQHVHALEEDAQLTKNMNNATAQLNLSSMNEELSMEEDEGKVQPQGAVRDGIRLHGGVRLDAFGGICVRHGT